jgi:hypothetical protein
MLATPKTPLSVKDAEALAQKWGTTVQTIYSWKKRGINLTSDAAVVEFLIASKNPTVRQLAAAADALAAAAGRKPNAADSFDVGFRSAVSPKMS